MWGAILRETADMERYGRMQGLGHREGLEGGLRKKDAVFVQKMKTCDRKVDMERAVSADIAYWEV